MLRFFEKICENNEFDKVEFQSEAGKIIAERARKTPWFLVNLKNQQYIDAGTCDLCEAFKEETEMTNTNRAKPKVTRIEVWNLHNPEDLDFKGKF